MIYDPRRPVESENLGPIALLEYYVRHAEHENQSPDSEAIAENWQVVKAKYRWAEYIRELTELLLKYDSRSDLFWNFEDGELKFYILCNDVFWWATADVEPIPVSKLAMLRQALEEGGAIWGCQLYCARSRGMRPQQPAYPKEPEYRELFDACGPERKKEDEG